jgi:hypothetical protein
MVVSKDFIIIPEIAFKVSSSGKQHEDTGVRGTGCDIIPAKSYTLNLLALKIIH